MDIGLYNITYGAEAVLTIENINRLLEINGVGDS